MNRHHGRVFFFAAEPASGLRLNHDCLFVVELERALERAMHVIRALK